MTTSILVRCVELAGLAQEEVQIKTKSMLVIKEMLLSDNFEVAL